MTIGGSDRIFFNPGKCLVPSIPVTFVTYSSPVLAYSPFFSHAYPMAFSFLTSFASPGVSADPEKFRRAPHPCHWRRL